MTALLVLMVVAAAVVAKTAFELALAAQPKLDKWLISFAARHTRPPDDPEDVVRLAYRRAWDREASGNAWNPASGPPFEKYMFEFVRGALSNHRRRGRKAPFEPLEDADAVKSAVPHIEQAVIAREEQLEQQSLLVKVRESLATSKHGTRAIEVMNALEAGITDYSEIAKSLNCELKDVRKARRAIGEHAKSLLKHLRAQAGEGES